MLKFLLLPLALIAAIPGLMILHIAGSTIHHRLAWNETLATVTHTEVLCSLTYQPHDAVLRQIARIGPCESIQTAPLPEGGSTPRVFDDLYGRLVYSAAGAEHSFDGKLSDAGVYVAEAGGTVSLLYDPANPKRLASGAMKGWVGGLIIMLCSFSFLTFYIWFFWLRRR